ncbi:hypothetical protein QJS04_geneDACA013300 [Acorus gramineus]|uniref:Uncharacterized protein n=1 Tax=Acorus gramineus TaxID=55184 RepID=A0AAV9BBU6_ACOGR|nr:hypothetical protein QJS04_geneDACA013300 [Acorus gramineus]
MGTYRQLILALEKDHRDEEAHKISVFVQFGKLFRDIESYDRRPTDKLTVQKVADAYELLGLPEDRKRILDKYDYLFNESSRLNFKISKTNSGKRAKTSSPIQVGRNISPPGSSKAITLLDARSTFHGLPKMDDLPPSLDLMGRVTIALLWAG